MVLVDAFFSGLWDVFQLLLCCRLSLIFGIFVLLLSISYWHVTCTDIFFLKNFCLLIVMRRWRGRRQRRRRKVGLVFPGGTVSLRVGLCFSGSRSRVGFVGL